MENCANLYYTDHYVHEYVYKLVFSSLFLPAPILPLKFTSHNGICEWTVRPAAMTEWLTQNFVLEVSLNILTNERPQNLQLNKIDIKIYHYSDDSCHITQEKDMKNVRDSFSTCFLLEKFNEYGFLNGKGYVNIVFSIHDITPVELTLKDDYEQLFESGEWSDFKIVIDKKIFRVHKNILAARSEYFSAMFKHGTKELCENQVEISEVHYEVMKEVLRFMYCGKANVTEELAYDLLVAADAYQMKRLKVKCEEEIINQLNSKNIGAWIRYADSCENIRLKEATIKFVVDTAACNELEYDHVKCLESIMSSISPAYSTRLACQLLSLHIRKETL